MSKIKNRKRGRPPSIGWKIVKEKGGRKPGNEKVKSEIRRKKELNIENGSKYR